MEEAFFHEEIGSPGAGEREGRILAQHFRSKMAWAGDEGGSGICGTVGGGDFNCVEVRGGPDETTLGQGVIIS